LWFIRSSKVEAFFYIARLLRKFKQASKRTTNYRGEIKKVRNLLR